MITKCSRCGTETYEGSTHFCMPPAAVPLSQSSESDEEAATIYAYGSYPAPEDNISQFDCQRRVDFFEGIQHGRMSAASKIHFYQLEATNQSILLEKERQRSAALLSALKEAREICRTDSTDTVNLLGVSVCSKAIQSYERSNDEVS